MHVLELSAAVVVEYVPALQFTYVGDASGQ